jgi:hypothetical protein
MAFEQVAMTVLGPAYKEEGMQESDMLDQLPDGKAQEDSGSDHVMLVSLGCFCGPKLSFKNIGRGSATLPFDWIRTRHQGLVHFIDNGFDGFYDFATKKSVPGCSMTTYRSFYHSFWHDDPTDPGMRERYARRIERFQAINADTAPVLFVRTIPSTDEIKDIPELLNVLQKNHGTKACLLLVIDFQWTAKGAAIVDGFDNLLIFYLSSDHHVGEDGTPTAPYCKPVLCALDWIVGKQIPAMKFTDLEKVAACADETHWGIQGLGGLAAFESSLQGPEEDSLPPEAVPFPHLLPPLSSDLLEEPASGLPPATPDDGTTVVSLGCYGIVKRTLQQMGRGREALPFDWLQISHEGLVHFLRKGFESPIRPGLGAGGQRPTERHGFFDIATRKPVPGTSLTLCRSHFHSFLHDDMGQPETKTKYAKRIEQFARLAFCDQSLIFVRTVARSDEVSRADELLGALRSYFGQGACLLIIVDFQCSNSGAFVVEGLDDLLVYHLNSSNSSMDDVAPYRSAVECALEWSNGKPIEASSVADLQTLQRLTDITCWGLRTPGGLHAFEGGVTTSSDGQNTPKSAAENAWLEEVRLEVAKESVAVVSLGGNDDWAQACQELGLSAEASPFCDNQVHLQELIDILEAGAEGFSGAQEKWEARQSSIDHFLGPLSKTDRSKLFVHTMADSSGLGALDKLLKALLQRFGENLCVLIIVGGQAQQRVVSVESHYNILVQFVLESAPACCEPLRQSLDWVVGKPMPASVVADFESLQNLANPWTRAMIAH